MSETRKDNYAALYKAAHKLYFAGVWTCEQRNENEQVALWEALRDALGLNEGSATAQGVAATPTPPEQGEVRTALATMALMGAMLRRDARLPHPDYDREPVQTDEFTWGDVHALLARVAPQGERWVCVDCRTPLNVGEGNICAKCAHARATPPAAETGEQGVWVNGQLSTLAALRPTEPTQEQGRVASDRVREARGALDLAVKACGVDAEALTFEQFTAYVNAREALIAAVRAECGADTARVEAAVKQLTPVAWIYEESEHPFMDGRRPAVLVSDVLNAIAEASRD